MIIPDFPPKGRHFHSLKGTSVYRVKDEDLVAKVLNPAKAWDSEYSKILFRYEGSLELDHPHVVKVKQKVSEIEVVKGEPWLYFLMEYAGSKTLRGELSLKNWNLETSDALKYIKQILEGLEYVHGQGVVHYDMKPENVMLNNSDIKIIDFGFSNWCELLKDCKGYPGTHTHMPPEFSLYGPAYDIFTMGTTSYELLTGLTPEGNHVLPVEHRVIHTDRLPEDLTDIIMKAVGVSKQYDSASEMLGDVRQAIHSYK